LNPLSPARTVAFVVLLKTERGGYASDLLFSAAKGLDSRDAGLANEIVFGSLRYQAQLDYLIRCFSGRDAMRLDAEVRIVLRMAVYQLRYLDRVPAHAAVSEAVELVKRARKRSAAGFVNAVLRKVDRRPAEWPTREIALSCPEWLLERWEARFGPGSAESIASAFLKPPETYVRAPHGPPPGAELEPAEIPGCYRLVSGDPEGLRIQDIGSQSIVPLLDLRPGLTFLDLCAAPGNKTAQALESGVLAVACDRHPRRLAALRDLGCARVALDATLSLPFHTRFDRILVDAPCSGTGTLGRNPEIKWRIQPSVPAELHALQTRILRNALDRLAPGGKLVYSTCSLEREENEDVVTEVLGKLPETTARRTPGRDAGDGFFSAVIPSE
jgi:16S rRNA (cytosine967-C5)-methyltransferase